jgi:hypothetical protein
MCFASRSAVLSLAWTGGRGAELDACHAESHEDLFGADHLISTVSAVWLCAHLYLKTTETNAFVMVFLASSVALLHRFNLHRLACIF